MKKESFFQLQKKVVDNLEILQMMLVNITEEEPLFDPESVLYNELYAILDEATSPLSYLELREIVNKGKQIEHNIDVWLAERGRTSTELHWPEINI